MADRQSHEESLEGASAQVNMVGKFLYKISARHSTDKLVCSIKSAVLLPGGRLAVVDLSNKCVKLLDLEARKLTGTVVLPSEPQDITAIGEDRLAVVFHNWWYIDENKQRQYENKEVQFLQLLRVKPKLARSSKLPLPGRFYSGVTCRGEKLYLACWNPRSIQIFKLNGTLLNQINNENDWFFGVPCFPAIAVSPDGAHIYVHYWDAEVNKVVCLTTEGQKVWTFDSLLFYGMDVDKQGRLFMCGDGDPPIKILSSAGRPGTLLLDEEVGWPWTVAVGDGRMCLGRDNEILVFRLEAADSARQLQYVCEDLPPPADQSLNLSGDISLRDNTRDRESYRLSDNNRYDSPSENQRLELPSDTNRDRESCRLPGSNRPDILLEDREEEPPVKLPKFE